MTVNFENLAPVLALSSRTGEPRPSDHFVEFYEVDSSLIDSLARYVGGGLKARDAVIVVATDEHRRSLEKSLATQGWDAEELASVRWIDAGSALEVFMRGDIPDADTFKRHFGSVIDGAAADGQPVRIFGEMVALLWAGGNSGAALQVEDLWNELAKTHAFRLFCGYPTEHFGGTNLGSIRSVCQKHTHVLAELQATV
jgi:MEDS: MEthanogen/methylotroph, DcmR Sensory domain